MEYSTRPLTVPRTAIPAANAGTAPLRNVLQTFFWSPVLLLSAVVHLLCQPLTQKCLLGLMILDLPLEWGAHLDYRPDAELFGAIEGFDFSITTVALCGLYIGWFFTARTANRWPRISWTWPIAAYTLVVMASWFVASDPQLSQFEIFLLVEMLLFYIYVAGNIDSREEIVYILYLLLAGGILESLYMLTIAAAGHQFSFVRSLGIKTLIDLPRAAGDFTRQGGTVGSPNYTSAYLGMLISLALSVRQMRVPSRLRRLTIPALILAALALATTFSRGGWIGVVLSVAVLGGANWLRGGVSRGSAFTAAAAVSLVLLCLFIPNPVSRRLSEDDNGSAHSRVPLMHLAYRVIAANPVLGVGANNFAAVMNDYAGSEFRHEWIYTVHNEFLLVCSETGLIGLVAYLWIYFSVIRKGWRIWKTGDEMFAPLALGFVAAICGLLSHMFVDLFSGRAIFELVWLFAALIGIFELIQRREWTEPSLSSQARPAEMS
jgi:O-antigen ligase